MKPTTGFGLPQKCLCGHTCQLWALQLQEVPSSTEAGNAAASGSSDGHSSRQGSETQAMNPRCKVLLLTHKNPMRCR